MRQGGRRGGREGATGELRDGVFCIVTVAMDTRTYTRDKMT